MNWILLVVAGLCEVGFTYCLARAKLVTGMEWWLWMGGFLAFTFVSMGLLAAIQKIGESYRVSKENKQRVIAIASRNRR